MIVRSHQSQLLQRADAAVCSFSKRFGKDSEEARFQLLEAVASRLGGFSVKEYFGAFGTKPLVSEADLLKASRAVVAEIERSGIPPALAVSALGKESLSKSEKRKAGAYYTDYRLAMHLAQSLEGKLSPGVRVVDPACGAGILLAAVTLVACGADRRLTASWLENSIFASDLSANALRGSQAALACLTDDLQALKTMRRNWKVQDSLVAGLRGWKDISSAGFDVVVANPPWEKIKITRHEFIQASGVDRHYGKGYEAFDDQRYRKERDNALSYGARLADMYATLDAGEPDLYAAFTELFLNLAKKGGAVRALLPAGLIRSQGTESLRQLLWSSASELEFEVFENRARFFEIDTRFKFLMVGLTKAAKGSRVAPIQLKHGVGTSEGVDSSPRVRVSRSALASLRPDLSLPEVRDDAEWRLYQKMSKHAVNWAEAGNPWFPEFMREVDMTRDKSLFRAKKITGAVPLIEGRMVHQHRFGAKSYVSGTGRRAIWDVNGPGSSVVSPQFWVPLQSLPARVRDRSKVARAGFCDITGQTNERSCMAAMIPPGVVCGNKVPTILFPNDPTEERLWLWLAIANSLPFDWMLRRVVTTTINYFLLVSVPLPPLQPNTLPGRQLIEIAKTLHDLDSRGSDCSKIRAQIGELRAKADLLVATAYGLSALDIRLILEDFPLLDRRQPVLPYEARSTVTRDCLLRLFERVGGKAPDSAGFHSKRYDAARELGAVPYLPSQVEIAASVDAEEMAYGY